MLLGWIQLLITVVIVLIVVLIFKVSKIYDTLSVYVKSNSDKSEVEKTTSDFPTVGYQKFQDVRFKNEPLKEGQEIKIRYDDYIKLLNELYDEPMDINGLTLDNTNQLIIQRVRQLRKSEIIRREKKDFWR